MPLQFDFATLLSSLFSVFCFCFRFRFHHCCVRHFASASAVLALRYLGIGKVAAYSSFDHNIFVEEAVMETLPGITKYSDSSFMLSLTSLVRKLSTQETETTYFGKRNPRNADFVGNVDCMWQTCIRNYVARQRHQLFENLLHRFPQKCLLRSTN
ncbi:uncharacterized protein [Arachis hypogaea]|uniref:uncharacterized protein isoform X8 n=1 Tax=Arachis hypogaea TaxID=3818 RepID=UPI003B220059